MKDEEVIKKFDKLAKSLEKYKDSGCFGLYRDEMYNILAYKELQEKRIKALQIECFSKFVDLDSEIDKQIKEELENFKKKYGSEGLYYLYYP